MLLKKETVFRGISGTLAIALIATSTAGCSLIEKEATAQSMTTTKTVKTITTEPEEYIESIDFKGYIFAKDVKKLSFQQGGEIKEIYVEDGQYIKAGDMLAELDTTYTGMAVDNARQNISIAENSISQLQSGVEQISLGIEAEKVNLKKVEDAYIAEQLNLKKLKDSYESAIDLIRLSYDNIEDTYDKMQILYNAGSVSKKDLDDAKYAYDSIVKELEKTEQVYANDLSLQEKNIENVQNNIELQKINIRNMESQLSAGQKQIEGAGLQKNQAAIGLQQYTEQMSDSIMTSPIDGYVISVSAQAGEITGAGVPVIVIKSENQIVNIGVPVNDLSKVKIGMPVKMESNGSSFNGVVSVVSQYPDESSRTYTVEITPDKTDLAIGSIVDVKIPIETTSVIQIPIKAIINIEGVNYVYCIENYNDGQGKAIMKEVILGEVNGDKVAVQNMEQGIVIVADGVKNIKENDSLVIAE